MVPKFAKSRFLEDFRALTEKVGQTQLTLFERRVLPLVFGKRDLAIETPAGENLTTSLVLSALGDSALQDGHISCLILTARPESVREIGQTLRTAAARWNKKAHTVAIGMDENIKKELQLLSRPPDMIVGTPERLIDHIRRENLAPGSVRRVVVDLPPDYAESGFDKDLLFVYSKLPKRVRTILFAPEITESVSALLKRPLSVALEHEPAEPAEAVVYRATDGEAKRRLVADLLENRKLHDCVVTCGSRSTADQIVAALTERGIPARRFPQSGTTADREECERALQSGTTRAVVTDSFQSIVGLPTLKHLVCYEMPSDIDSYSALEANVSNSTLCSPFFCLVSSGEESAIEAIQEVTYVDTNNGRSNDDILKGKIQSIVKRIKEEGDPEELNRLRRLVRRNVPIFMRGYFMAYLLKQGPSNGVQAQDTKTLFVSIGKNRRVFPRDLSRLFSSTLEIKAEAIGNIKVLDNYSFIDVPESLAEKAISLLDGRDFRGRKITVNHARKKEEN